jgi:hypothetical protein
MRMSLDGIRRHLDAPSSSHLRPMLTDIVSTFEDLQNDFERRVSEIVPGLVAAGAAVMLPDLVAHYLEEQLPAIVARLLAEGMKEMDDLVTKLTASVANLTSVVSAHDAVLQSAVTDLKSIVTQGTASGTLSADDAAAIMDVIGKIDASAAQVKGETDALAGAMASNPTTSAAPAPAAAPSAAAAPAPADPANPAAPAAPAA